MGRLKKEEFEEVLKPIHNTFWKQAAKRLMSKISRLKSSLKRRSLENEVEFNVSTDEIKKMFLEQYGQPCKYCDVRLTYRNIACDHIIPVSKEGPSIAKNLQLICKHCNTRKGPLDEKDFNLLINLVLDLPVELSKYVMRKLAKGGKY